MLNNFQLPLLNLELHQNGTGARQLYHLLVRPFIAASARFHPPVQHLAEQTGEILQPAKGERGFRPAGQREPASLSLCVLCELCALCGLLLTFLKSNNPARP